MDISKLSTGTKVVLGAGLLLLLVSFFSWFEVDGFGGVASMWEGFGFIAGLALLALLAWEIAQLAGVKLEFGISPALVTVALAILVGVIVLLRVLVTPGPGHRGRRRRPHVLGVDRAPARARGRRRRGDGACRPPARASRTCVARSRAVGSRRDATPSATHDPAARNDAVDGSGRCDPGYSGGDAARSGRAFGRTGSSAADDPLTTLRRPFPAP